MWVCSVKKTPTTRQEKVSLQRRNRAISGLTIDKGWNEKTLDNKVMAQFPEECKGTEFELVKENVSGVLVKPIFASGVKSNGNILLESIASTGVVYVRLLREDDPDEDSGFVWVMENLKSHGISQFHFPDLESPEI